MTRSMNLRSNTHHKLFTTDDRITAGILFGDIKDMAKLKKQLRKTGYKVLYTNL